MANTRKNRDRVVGVRMNDAEERQLIHVAEDRGLKKGSMLRVAWFDWLRRNGIEPAHKSSGQIKGRTDTAQ